MRNSTVKKDDSFERIANDNSSKSLESLVKRHRMIALEVEVACNLDGNINDPDFDEFTRKYGLCCFA